MTNIEIMTVTETEEIVAIEMIVEEETIAVVAQLDRIITIVIVNEEEVEVTVEVEGMIDMMIDVGPEVEVEVQILAEDDRVVVHRPRHLQLIAQYLKIVQIINQ